MTRRIITVVLAALAAIALCALAAPHAHAATVGDMPPAADSTDVDGGGWIDVPQTGRGPSMEEQPAPGGRTHLRDVLRPCLTEADALDGCYDAAHDSGLWRSPDGGEYRTWDDGTWEWTPASPASDGPEGASDGPADDAAPEALADADDAMTAPDADQYADDDAAAPADDDQYAGDGQYAPDGSRVALAHTGPSTAMAAALAAGAAAVMAGAALMARARAAH